MLVSNNVKQLHNISSSAQILQNFYLPFYLHSYQLISRYYINVQETPLIAELKYEGLSIQPYIIHTKTDSTTKIKSHLLLLYGFEDLDNAFFIVGDIYALKNLTIFSPSHFSNNLVIILITENPQK